MNPKHKVCIKVNKVYDWVSRQVDLPLQSISGDDFNDLFDCTGSDPTPADDVCAFLSGKKFETVCKLVPDSLFVQEMNQNGGRQQVTVTLPNREKVKLEKVKVLVKGLVDITIVDEANHVLCRANEPIQFVTVQTFFLCAPEGTMLHAHVVNFLCNAETICAGPFQQLDVSISLCLDVQMEAEVKLEIEAEFCKPREELNVNLSDIACEDVKFPPQCPSVFPGKHSHK